MQSLLFTRSRTEYHRFYDDLVITEGVRRILDILDIYWFLDFIYLEKQEELTIYQISKKGRFLEIICKDYTDKVFKRIHIEKFFPLKEFTLFYQHNTILLPIEY